MYAVVRTGGKQYRVTPGQRLDIERVDSPEGGEVVLVPVLVVDGEEVRSTPDQLAGASVTARVVGESKGPKIVGFTYKNKTNQRRRWGHRQGYTTIEITGISKGSKSSSSSKSTAKAAEKAEATDTSDEG
jgi:large subunit ribosomal protein L21